jgi:hypothetical protein
VAREDELPGCATIQFIVIALIAGLMLWGMFYDWNLRGRYHRDAIEPRPPATGR